jgi:WD40 repeat protein
MVRALSSFAIALSLASLAAGQNYPREVRQQEGVLREGNCVAYSPDGGLLAVGGQGRATGEVKLLDAATGNVVRAIKVGEAPVRIAFQPDGEQLAAGQNGKLTLWNVTNGKAGLALQDVVHDGGWSFSPDGTQLATANQDKTVTVWDTASGDEVLSFSPGGDEPLANPLAVLAWTPGGEALLGVERGATVVRSWKAATGEPLKQVDVGVNVGYLAFDRDGKRILIGANPASIWDAKSGAKLFEHDWRLDAASRFAITADARLGAIGGLPANRDDAGPIRVWDIEAGEALFDIEAETYPRELAFSPDGGQLAGVFQNGRVAVWQVAAGSGQPIAVRPPRDDPPSTSPPCSPGTRRPSAAWPSRRT